MTTENKAIRRGRPDQSSGHSEIQHFFLPPTGIPISSWGRVISKCAPIGETASPRVLAEQELEILRQQYCSLEADAQVATERYEHNPTPATAKSKWVTWADLVRITARKEELKRYIDSQDCTNSDISGCYLGLLSYHQVDQVTRVINSKWFPNLSQYAQELVIKSFALGTELERQKLIVDLFSTQEEEISDQLVERVCG